MNYIKHYDLLMSKAQLRKKPLGYCELHHIVPRHAGGSDEKSNLVYLTAREHFIAHYLRAKAFGGADWKAVTTFKMDSLQNQRYVNSRLYENARLESAKVHSKIMFDMYKNNPSRIEKIRQEQIAIQNISNNKKIKKERMEKLWQDEEWVINLKKSRQESMTDNRRKQLSINASKAWNTFEHHAKMCAIQKEIQNRPEVIEKKRIKGLERAKNVDFRSSMKHAKKIICVENNMLFLTITLAGDWLRESGHVKASTGTLNMALTGKRKSAYGFHWKYA